MIWKLSEQNNSVSLQFSEHFQSFYVSFCSVPMFSFVPVFKLHYHFEKHISCINYYLLLYFYTYFYKKFFLAFKKVSASSPFKLVSYLWILDVNFTLVIDHNGSYNNVLFSFIASGVGPSPSYCGRFWPIVPAPDDRWGWLWSTGENLFQRHFVHHKSHLTRPGIEPGPPRWEASD
jgi:hypothetical protein